MATGLKKQKRKYGSDLIVDILKQHDISYVTYNPGSTLSGLQDSMVNYAGNTNPELIQCCHENIAVAIAHGYAKASGKYLAVCVHSNVGLQNASMAIFNAWCDRVPLLVIGGIGPLDLTKRRPWIDWIHTSNNQSSIIRDYVKWHDQPYNVASVPESLYRACRITNTIPKAPVYISVDTSIQEAELDKQIVLHDVSKYLPPTSPCANTETLLEVANLLVTARSPVIIADYMGRDLNTVDTLVSLAELLGISVIDSGGRYNFPNNHPLCLTGINKEFLTAADLVLALDVNDLYGALGEIDEKHSNYHRLLNSKAKIVHISMNDYLLSSWAADYQKLCPIDISIAADTAIVLPKLYDLCKNKLTTKAKNKIKRRFCEIKIKHETLRKKWQVIAIQQKTKNPLTIPAVLYAIWTIIKNEDWVLANNGNTSIGPWIKKLWEFEKKGCYVGESGGAGLGYGLGAAIGVALAYKNSDKLCINIQADGDLLFTPSALWTAAHHEIPLLTIVINNRSYGNIRKHVFGIAASRARKVNNTDIGINISNPAVDFTMLARSFGITSFGKISSLSEIKQTIVKAIEIIKNKKQPVLIDILVGS